MRIEKPFKLESKYKPKITTEARGKQSTT